jgi:hypothetical protein
MPTKVFLFSILVLLFSCSTPVPKPQVGKKDTLIVAFKPKKGLKGPVQLYLAADSTYVKIVNDPATLKGSYVVGYRWRVKISDTTPDGHGHQFLDTLKRPVPLWQDVPDSLTSYFTPLLTGN